MTSKNAVRSSKLTLFGVRPTSPMTNYCDKKLHSGAHNGATLIDFWYTSPQMSEDTLQKQICS